MKKFSAICLLFPLLTPAQDGHVHDAKRETWRAWLQSSGGELPFHLETLWEPSGWKCWVINGEEKALVQTSARESNEILMSFDVYNSEIRAVKEGETWKGEWRKQKSGDRVETMNFFASEGQFPRFTPIPMPAVITTPKNIAGRWAVKFSTSKEPAVGIFAQESNGRVTGTFLTTTGDYRFLEGSLEGEQLRLSCFDGAHAFLFHATLKEDGTLAGDFWSGASSQEKWSAKKDANAKLPDPFQLALGKPVELSKLAFPDLENRIRTLDEEAFAGKARILNLFGTWCPNCNDEAPFLAELDKKYRSQGLSIVALAFEVSGDFYRDVAQVHKFAGRHGLQYPILIGGPSDKKKASEVFPLLDQVRAYPTTIFLDGKGKIRAIHSGYAGPATGEEHRRLREKFESIVKELLAEPSR